MRLYLNIEDISQIIIGAFALAVPIAFSQEAWDLGSALPPANLVMLFVLSMVFLSFYAYQCVFQGNIRFRRLVFIGRVLFAYLLAGLVVAMLLFALNKFPILTEPVIAIKRLIVITMPASMGAIIVDSFDKE